MMDERGIALTVHLRKPFFLSLLAMHSAQSVPTVTPQNFDAQREDVEKFLSQLVEVQVAEYRKMRIKPHPGLPEIGKREDLSQLRTNVHQHQLTPVEVQTLIHLHEVERMTITELAARFHCSGTKIRRVLANRKPPTQCYVTHKNTPRRPAWSFAEAKEK
jgi:hypothetical protein